MERLTYKGTPYMSEEGMVTPVYCDYPVRRIISKLAEYEDAEEQGLLLKSPCETEAYEKQLPKEPIYKGEYILCPSCSSVVVSNYCCECGQKIDWN